MEELADGGGQDDLGGQNAPPFGKDTVYEGADEQQPLESQFGRMVERVCGGTQKGSERRRTYRRQRTPYC